MAVKDTPDKLLKPVEGAEEIQALFEELTGDTSEPQFTSEKPLYVQAAEARAARMGVSSEHLLAEYACRLKESRFPTPECLRADVVQAHIGGVQLSEEQVNHINACEPCRKLIEASRPPEDAVSSLLEEVRSMAVRASKSEQIEEKNLEARLFAMLSPGENEKTEGAKPLYLHDLVQCELPSVETLDTASVLQAAVVDAWLALPPKQRDELRDYINAVNPLNHSASKGAGFRLITGRIAMKALRIQVQNNLLARKLPSKNAALLCKFVDEDLVRNNLMSATFLTSLPVAPNLIEIFRGRRSQVPDEKKSRS